MSLGGLTEGGWRSAMGHRTTLLAFALLVVIGGSNAVAVRFSNPELPPFWGAGIGFAAAGLIYWLILLARLMGVPTLPPPPPQHSPGAESR